MKKRKRRKYRHVRTLDDYGQELLAKNLELERKQAEEYYILQEEKKQARADERAEKRPSKPARAKSLSSILAKGKCFCPSCERNRPLAKYYTTFSASGKLLKIWPRCKLCESKRRKETRTSNNFALVSACLHAYSRNKHKAIFCSLCNCSDIKELTLFDNCRQDTRAIVSYRTYKWLHAHNFPKMKFDLLCYDCAFKIMNDRIKHIRQRNYRSVIHKN